MTQIKFADDILLQFDQLNSEFTDNAFGMGDLAAQVVDEYLHVAEHADILRSLGNATHIQYDTLRDRERVARAIPRSARMQYPLSFHQWRACLSLKSNPLEVADWCVSQDKLPTVNEIRLHVQGISLDEPAWLRRFIKLQEAAQVILSDDRTPPHVVEALVPVVSIVPQHPPYP